MSRTLGYPTIQGFDQAQSRPRVGGEAGSAISARTRCTPPGHAPLPEVSDDPPDARPATRRIAPRQARDRIRLRARGARRGGRAPRASGAGDEPHHEGDDRDRREHGRLGRGPREPAPDDAGRRRELPRDRRQLRALLDRLRLPPDRRRRERPPGVRVDLRRRRGLPVHRALRDRSARHGRRLLLRRGREPRRARSRAPEPARRPGRRRDPRELAAGQRRGDREARGLPARERGGGRPHRLRHDPVREGDPGVRRRLPAPGEQQRAARVPVVHRRAERGQAARRAQDPLGRVRGGRVEGHAVQLARAQREQRPDRPGGGQHRRAGRQARHLRRARRLAPAGPVGRGARGRVRELRPHRS